MGKYNFDLLNTFSVNPDIIFLKQKYAKESGYNYEI